MAYDILEKFRSFERAKGVLEWKWRMLGEWNALKIARFAFQIVQDILTLFLLSHERAFFYLLVLKPKKCFLITCPFPQNNNNLNNNGSDLHKRKLFWGTLIANDG